MNFFYLDEDPWRSIEYHCDKHIGKMPTEYKQMLSTAHRVLDGEMYYDKTKNGRKIKRWKHPDRKMNIHIGMVRNMVQKRTGGYLEIHLRICQVLVRQHQYHKPCKRFQNAWSRVIVFRHIVIFMSRQKGVSQHGKKDRHRSGT